MLLGLAATEYIRRVNLPGRAQFVGMLQVAQDLIWVWAENGPDAGLESTLTPPLLLPALADAKAVEDGRVLPQPVGHRDVAYGWDTLMENIVVGAVAGTTANVSGWHFPWILLAHPGTWTVLHPPVVMLSIYPTK